MPFFLNNAPTIFSRIVIKPFQEYLYKIVEVYFNDWTFYGSLKEHVNLLHEMIERCRQIQFSLNLKKCIFSTPIGILLEHVMCKEGIKVDLAKIKVILDLKPPLNPKQARAFLGHVRYSRKLIRHYLDIMFQWKHS